MKKLVLTLLTSLFAFASHGTSPEPSGMSVPGFEHYKTYESRLRPRFLWELDVDMWFDNREYKSEYSEDMTLAGMKIVPQIGIGWRNNGLSIGTTVVVDFGDRNYRRHPELVFYYNYQDYRFSAYAGVFQRSVMTEYPRVFISDSTRYYDNNIDGAFFRYAGRRGYLEFAMDWLNMISNTQREKFVLFSAAQIRSRDGKFSAGYYAHMFHHSVTYQDEGVVDYLMAYPYVEFQLLRGSLESRDLRFLTLTAGWIQSLQRDRFHENMWRKPGGFQLQLKIQKWGVGVDNTLYIGNNQMPLYERYGSGLYQGDSFYRTDEDVYNRAEIYWSPLRSIDKCLRIGAVFHYDGKKLSTQQLVTFSINLNRYTIRGY